MLTVKEAAPAKDKIGTRKAKGKSYPSDNPFLKVAEEQGWKPPLDVAQALAGMTYPGNVHETQIRVAASLARAGIERADVVQTILDATLAVDGTARWDWKAEEKAIGGHYDSAVAKFGAHAYAPAYAPEVSRETPTLTPKTPQKTDSVAGNGAPIGLQLEPENEPPKRNPVENVVPFAQNRAKAAQNCAKCAEGRSCRRRSLSPMA